MLIALSPPGRKGERERESKRQRERERERLKSLPPLLSSREGAIRSGASTRVTSGRGGGNTGFRGRGGGAA